MRVMSGWILFLHILVLHTYFCIHTFFIRIPNFLLGVNIIFHSVYEASDLHYS